MFRPLCSLPSSLLSYSANYNKKANTDNNWEQKQEHEEHEEHEEQEVEEGEVAK